ncbi:hypothetical protein Hanom_Chr00s006753g01735451 [Helianthus anomalus]
MRRCSRKFLMFLHNLCLEEKAKHIIASEIQMINFKDVVSYGSSVNISTFMARTLKASNWFNFMMSEDELVSESKLLKMYLEDPVLLEDISFDVISTFKDHVTKMESIIENELSLRFESIVILKLRESCAFFNCGSKALIFVIEVELLLVDAKCYHVTYADRSFWKSLIDGFNWLKQAVEILGSCNVKRFSLSDVKEAWRQSKMIKISFPFVVDRLLDAIKRHK